MYSMYLKQYTMYTLPSSFVDAHKKLDMTVIITPILINNEVIY